MHNRTASLLAGILTLGLRAGVAASPCTVAANVTVVRGSYMAGEPIELRLTANNVGSEPVRISADYPTFEGFDGSGLRFTPVEERLPAHNPAPPQDPYSISASHRVPLVPLAKGATWSVSLFLQAFMPGRVNSAAGFLESVEIMRRPKLERLAKNVRSFFMSFKDIDFQSLSTDKVHAQLQVNGLSAMDLLNEYSEEPQQLTS